MSSEHFHVHGAHEHEVEHKAHAGDSFAARVAVMTAVLATIGALMSYQGGATQNDALLFKNEAAIRKTEEFERASVEANAHSEASMHVHHRWAQATTLVQISIALAAIALLTRRKWMLWGVYGAALGGGVLATLAALHI